MVRTLIKKVVLYDDKIEIHYKYTPDKLPDYPENTDNRDFLYLDSSIFTSSRAPREKASLVLAFSRGAPFKSERQLKYPIRFAYIINYAYK